MLVLLIVKAFPTESTASSHASTITSRIAVGATHNLTCPSILLNHAASGQIIRHSQDQDMHKVQMIALYHLPHHNALVPRPEGALHQDSYVRR